MNFINLIDRIRYRFHEQNPLIKVLVSRKAIIHNFMAYQKFTGLKIAPVLKSNGYGHGLIEIASILKGQDLPFFVVDSFYEAKLLRRMSISTPVLIIGYSRKEQIQSRLYNVAFTLTSLDQIRELVSSLKSKRDFHLKIDTGMRRQGVLPQELDEALALVKSNKRINLIGLCSHFADADGDTKPPTLRQIHVWNKAVHKVRMVIPEIQYFHLSASTGAAYTDKIDANVLRLGIGLYGYNRSPHMKINLLPALKYFATITQIKALKVGESLGYNFLFTAEKNIPIAIVAAGYFEGIDRRLTNRGVFLTNNKECPIAGRVCMNISMMNISNCPNVKIGDKVVVISDKPKDKNSVENLAKICGTNPHDILVHIPQHLKRIVI